MKISIFASLALLTLTLPLAVQAQSGGKDMIQPAAATNSEAFKRLDANNDGKLSREEFSRATFRGNGESASTGTNPQATTTNGTATDSSTNSAASRGISTGGTSARGTGGTSTRGTYDGTTGSGSGTSSLEGSGSKSQR